jgi:hypothetical protein
MEAGQKNVCQVINNCSLHTPSGESFTAKIREEKDLARTRGAGLRSGMLEKRA